MAFGERRARPRLIWSGVRGSRTRIKITSKIWWGLFCLMIHLWLKKFTNTRPVFQRYTVWAKIWKRSLSCDVKESFKNF